MVLQAAEQEPVFVKDMCYYVIDYVLDDSAFLTRVKNTFLIRDPARAVVSYYKLDADFTEEEIGIEAQYRVFERVRALQGSPPIVLDAFDLQQDPDATLRAYCAALDIPHRESALNWDGPLPDDWQFVAGWHAGVAGSTGIVARKESAPVDLDAHPKLRRSYERHLPYYQKMRAHRLVPAPRGLGGD